ncbi:hypothetical protein AAZV13_09G163200 [Glycine max]
MFVKMPDRNSSVHTQSITAVTPRRSPRFPPQQNNDTPTPKSAKRSVSSNKSDKCAVGSRRSPRLNNVEQRPPPLRRCPRLNNESSDKKLKDTRKKRNRKRIEVETQENGVVSDKGFVGGRKKEENEERVKTKANCFVLDEGFDGGREKGVNGEKRKRGGEEISKGWTKEQELALQRAYLAAKPSPHFWKNVSKLVPGKSQQDCFDRIHCDYMTPPETQPRLRAKTFKSSPIHQFSISASKLLKPMDKTARRSNVLKPKNIITQKSVDKLLQRHLKVDLDREGDIFSVLEPNTDFSTNALQPSEALSTPKQQKENKGFPQNCTETSSSSHKKPPSRLSGSCVTELVSPPVLKKVKNRVMHEKYINQLRCRESRRRADATKIIEGTSIQKRDVVNAAKVALQVNFVDNTSSSGEDNDDGIEFEDESQ